MEAWMGAELDYVYVRVPALSDVLKVASRSYERENLTNTSTVALMLECYPGPAIECGLGG